MEHLVEQQYQYLFSHSSIIIIIYQNKQTKKTGSNKNIVLIFMSPVVIGETYCFCPVCLFVVCLLDNFNIGHKLWTLSDRAFIFSL